MWLRECVLALARARQTLTIGYNNFETGYSCRDSTPNWIIYFSITSIVYYFHLWLNLKRRNIKDTNKPLPKLGHKGFHSRCVQIFPGSSMYQLFKLASCQCDQAAIVEPWKVFVQTYCWKVLKRSPKLRQCAKTQTLITLHIQAQYAVPVSFQLPLTLDRVATLIPQQLTMVGVGMGSFLCLSINFLPSILVHRIQSAEQIFHFRFIFREHPLSQFLSNCLWRWTELPH